MDAAPTPRRRRWTRAALVVAAVCVGGLLALGLASSRDDAIGPIPLDGTEPAPAIAGPDLVTGKPITLESFRGRPVFVNAWASWCGPCRDEAPDFVRFVRDHPDVAVIGLNVNNDRADARAFAEEVGWTYPSIYDPDGEIGLDALALAQLPSTLYIDAQGRLRGQTSGPVTYDDLADVARRIR